MNLIIMIIVIPILLSFISTLWDPRLKPAFPPTYCVDGKERLRWYQPIPCIFGFGLMLRHQRRGGRVIWRYVIGEYITALLLVLAVQQIGWKPELAVAIWLTAILVIIVHTDLTQMIIPNKVVAAGLMGVVLLRWWSHPLPWYEYVIGAAAGSCTLLLIALAGELILRKEVMGGGDIKLYVFIGAVLGWKLALLSLFAASVIGFVCGSAALLFTTTKKGQTLPFGPYIAIASLIIYYWGDEWLSWYMSLLTVAG